MDNVRMLIPVEAQGEFDDIVTGRVLGASNHIKMIGNMFKSISKNGLEVEARKNINAVADYFIATRGKSSYAITAALTMMQDGIEEVSSNEGEAFDLVVEKAVNRYYETSHLNVEKVLEYSVELSKDYRCIMIYDYSSMVEKFVVRLPNPVKLYIPESRAIDGGKPFVKKALEAGHKVHFIPDAAMMTVIREVEAVYIGAETFYWDGTAFNTVGSDILAVLCQKYQVPYYVLTPLIKGDPRSIYGEFKQPILADLQDRLAKDWDEMKDQVAFTSLDLVGVDPEYITYFVTEKGIVRPQNLMTFSQFARKD